jgi:hypothetical protein
MGFWSKHFQQAAQIDTLRRDLEFEQRKNGELQSLVEREEWRVKELEKEVTRSRNSEMRTLRHHADVISKNVKTQSAFTLLAKEDEPRVPPPIDADLEAKIQFAAETALQMDIDEGITPLPLEHYVAIVRKSPEQYIFY